MRIRTQFLLSLLVFSLVLAAISTSAIITSQEVQRARAQENVAASIAQGASELSYLANDYVIYRESQQLQRWQSRFTSFSSEVASLSVAIPEQRQLVRNIQANTQRLKDVFDSVVSSTGNLSLESGTIDSSSLQVAWSRLAIQSQALVSDASRLSRQLDSEVNRLHQLNITAVLILIGVLIIYFVVNYLLMQSRILTGLARLKAGAAIIGASNLDFKIEEKQQDEIGDLSRAFNQMTSDLKAVTISKNDLENEINERKRAEEALRKSEERYRNLFSTMSEGFGLHEIILDAEGNPYDYRFLELNAAFEKMTGLSRDKSLGRSVREVIPGIESYWIEEYGRVALTGEPVHFENYSAPLKKWYEVYAYSPARKQFAVLFTDITERKKIEEGLKESEERFRTIAETAPVHIVISRPSDGTILYVNRAFSETFGYREGELVGRKIIDLYADPVDRAALIQALKDQGFVNDYIVIFKRTDGTRLWISVTLRKITYRGETVVMGASIDMTEHMKADQIKDEFIGMVSHELRTPLTIVTGAIHTAMMEGLPPEELLPLLHDAASGAESLADILDNLLELSRHQARRLVLSVSPTQIKEVIESAIGHVEGKSAIHTLVADLPEKLPPFQADKIRVERVLHNLIENAIKYSPRGGEVRITARQDGDSLIIGVSDQGIGISPEDRSLLFQPFQRLGQSSEVIKGLGLGLVVCLRLVEAHQGRIWVDSEPGKGSTFYFSLPIHPSYHRLEAN